MTVVDLGTDVRFDFRNLGPEMSTIARIYFDNGSLMNFTMIHNSPGVDFLFDPFPGPNDLPGGNLAVPPFMTTIGFLSGAGPPAPTMGVEPEPWGEPNEVVGLEFSLDPNQTTAHVIDELTSGVLRVGVHVINFASGGSESLINIPEPASWSLLGLGVAGLTALRRRSARA
jgi:hypothetical protein